jgi:hypothetical protein
MAVRCYMCGEPCTGRLTNDLDIPGIPLCDASRCKGIIVMMLSDPAGETWLERERKRLHMENGNKYTPDQS